MNANPADPSGLPIDVGTRDKRKIARDRPLTGPRPGHADLSGMLSYGLSDARSVLKRANARETAARVTLGVLAKALLERVAGVHLVSHVVSVGAQHATTLLTPTPADEAALCEASIRILDPESSARFKAAVDAAKQAGDTIGGVVGVIAYDVPVGLGTHMTARERLDARLAAALTSVQSAKGVEIGGGFTQAMLLGSTAYDEIVRGKDGHLARTSSHAGGIEGGTSNGASIVTRTALKPISTVPHALRSVNPTTGKEAVGLHRRSDTCQMVPGTIITETGVTLVLADAPSDRAGSRSVGKIRRNLRAYLAMVSKRT